MASPRKLKSVAGRAIRAAGGQILHCVPIPLWRALFPKPTLGLCYHLASDATLPHLKHYPVLKTADFEADLDYLQRTFAFISYEQLVKRHVSSNGNRDNSVVLTFDDGFAECANVVAPILLRRGLHCVFFVITDLIDNNTIFRESAVSLCIEAIRKLPVESAEAIVRALGLDAHIKPPPEKVWFSSERLPLEIAGLCNQSDERIRPLLHWLLTATHDDENLIDQLCVKLRVDSRSYLRKVQPYLTTQQIRHLHAEGFTIGAHSCSHRWLQNLSRPDAEHEIVSSCSIIREITGQSSVPFAFPYFGGGIDRGWLAQLRKQHEFIGLFFDTNGLREDEPFVVQRVFAERFGHDNTMDAILRRAWARPSVWRRHLSKHMENDAKSSASSQRPPLGT